MRSTAAIGLLALCLTAVGCGQGADGGTPNGAEKSPFAVASNPTPGGSVAGSGSLTAYVPAATPLRESPGGKALATLPKKTDFGSPQVVPVLERRDGWLRVMSSQLKNGLSGWIRADRAKLFRVDYTVEESLARRELTVRRGSRVVARTRTAIGRAEAPTPRGSFAVTDKLMIDRPGSPYACCVLALSAHQPKIPQGWGGGDRVAIHATSDPSSVGQAVSLGCLRVRTEVMRRLVKLVPLGTPVRVVA
ncbi:MAG: L,D-transpeptidase [Actinomycetota bacterium]|nr:L,D-transpeptidase [Actinomycetota bacterium]